jgi:hypothetical protein
MLMFDARKIDQEQSEKASGFTVGGGRSDRRLYWGAIAAWPARKMYF